MQSLNCWSTGSTVAIGGNTFSFTDTPTADHIVDARLVLGIYGGMADNTCNLNVIVNGNVVTPANFTVGGSGFYTSTGGPAADANQEFSLTDATKPNVYGSMSSGAWVVSIPVAGSLGTTSNSPNVINVTGTQVNGSFDGRIVYATLWEVYQNASLKNTFQYSVAEGSGDIYNSCPSNAPSGTTTVPSRWIDMGGFNTDRLQTAKLDALYTYTHSSQDNRLYLSGDDLHNGSLLGSASYPGSVYSPVQAEFDVPSVVSSSDNWVKFSVDPRDGVQLSSGTYGANVLRPQVVILDATSTVPEPSTICLLATAAGTLLALWWKNHRRI